ncbi:MAG: hypothetical protein ACE5IC_05725 [Candidatus Brocadiales bacterium]
MFKLKRRPRKRPDSLQAGREAAKFQRGRKVLKIAASIGVGVGTVLLAFMMTWIISL